MGPRPIEKAETKPMIDALARIGEDAIVSERSREEQHMSAVDKSSSGRRPTRYHVNTMISDCERSEWYILLHLSGIEVGTS